MCIREAKLHFTQCISKRIPYEILVPSREDWDEDFFGQNAYFYEAVEGVLTAGILLVAELCDPAVKAVCFLKLRSSIDKENPLHQEGILYHWKKEPNRKKEVNNTKKPTAFRRTTHSAKGGFCL